MRLSTSLPAAVSLTLFQFLLPPAAWADETSTCASACVISRQECGANVPRAASSERSLRIGNGEPNHFAMSVGQATPTLPPPPAADRSDYVNSRARRNRMCESAYASCMRDCGAPVPASGVSEVLTRQGQARSTGK